MRPVLTAFAILALSACSPADEPSSPSAPPEPPPMLGGVDLSQPIRALGTEPFWSIELTGTEMIYTSPEPSEQRARQPEPVVQGTTAAYESQTDGGAIMRVTLVATECSDGMSDRIYPLTALVKLGDLDLTGCAASTAAIMTTGESGPVVEKAQPAG